MKSTPDRAAEVNAIEEGRAAWAQIKKAATVDGYIVIGRALLAGRRICMREVKATKPFGGAYIQAFSAWLKANDFSDMTSSTRKCSMAVAANELDVRAWLSSIEEKPVHPVEVWRGFREQRAGRTAKRKHLKVSEDTVLAAWERVKVEAKNAARGLYTWAPGRLISSRLRCSPPH